MQKKVKLIVTAVVAAVALYAGLAPAPAIFTSQQDSNHGQHSQAHQVESVEGDKVSLLSRQNNVVNYLQTHQRLPQFYIRKNEARRQGWDSGAGNLCQVLPGRVIGGDRFSNREKSLPEQAGRQWYEADINYHCGRRGGDRLLFSSDGLIYATHDHYRHFERVN